MTLHRLMLMSLCHCWRANLGVLLGIALASTVITGALLVGDSMRYTLQRTAELRLGQVTHAIVGADRFFTHELALTHAPQASGVILIHGVASTPDGPYQANDVSVIGADHNAMSMIDSSDTQQARPSPKAGEAFINKPLAEQLHVSVGDTIILRLPKPSALPIDAALVNASKPLLALRVSIARIIDEQHGGRFSLRAEQRSPMNLFVDLNWLASEIGQPGRINTALMTAAPKALNPTLDDLELTIKPMPDGNAELSTPRVFLDASIEQDLQDLPGQRLLTYLVNTVAHGERESPYAMVTAADQLGELVLQDDEIAINSWLADDVRASVGDTLSLTYYLPDEGDRLLEAKAHLRVAQIVEIQGPFADRGLTPAFPGLAEAEQLSRWDAGPAIDRSRIRDKDEAYWDQYRTTPKAFISLRTGQKLWANRFGTLTAIRFAQHVSDEQVLDRIDVSALGLMPIDIQAQAITAAKGTIDFGQLFLSLSGFIIIAAVVLAALLFALSAEQRARQLGTLLAVGLTRQQALRLLLSEGLVVAVLGSMLGLLGAILYASIVTDSLAGVWSGAVAGSPVLLRINTLSLLAGPIVTVLISLIAMGLSIRRLASRPPRELLAGGIGSISARPALPACIPLCAAILVSISTVLFMFRAQVMSGMSAGLMGFAAGASALACGILVLIGILMRLSGAAWCHPERRYLNTRPKHFTRNRLAIQSLTRRRGRTLTATVTLSCGVFLVLAVNGFRLIASNDSDQRDSGTGGFALLVETSQPIRYDLNTQLGRDHYTLSEDELPPGSVVPIRVSVGDDASCLNLNQTSTPRLLGINPEQFTRRNAFHFTQQIDPSADWAALTDHPDLDQPIPAIADANTAQWALKLGLGDTLTINDQQGQPVTFQLVGMIENSILQGSLIVHEDAFKRLFPATSGYRMLLVDVPVPRTRDQAASLLQEVLFDEGAQVTPTPVRLNEFNRVQNTYLAVFQSLGGLGVLLGSLGLGVVTARNLIERQSELALLSAVGLSRATIIRLVLSEHSIILVLGLLLGYACASLATWHAREGLFNFNRSDILVVLAPFLAGLLAIASGLAPAFRSQLTRALRND